MMKLLNILVVLTLTIYSYSQEVKPPAVLINSLELKSKIINGKEHFNLINNEKALYNLPYCIMLHVESNKNKKDYNPITDSEGNDIPKDTFFKGIYTGLDNKGIFKKGYKTGLWKTTYKNKLVKTINYKNGLVIGKYRVYDTKGTIRYKTTFGSKGNGKFKDYFYKTGILKQEGNYENGIKEGEWCNYNEEGEIDKIFFYKKGIPQKSK